MIKLGLVGWGYWGRNYAKYCSAHIDAQLAVVCDVRGEMLADAKAWYPHMKTTTSVRDLFAAGLDGVIIATGASTHYDLACDFVKAHVPLLIEKPLTHSYESSRKLQELADAEKTKILVGHTFLYNPSVRYLAHQIQNGVLGKLYYLEFRRQSYGPIRDDVNVLWDFAPHDLAMTKCFLGGALPVSVYAKGGKFSRNSMEDIVVIVMIYPGNVMVNINVAWLYPIKIRTLTLLGDKKMAVFEDTNANEPVKIYDTSLQYPAETEESGASFRLGDVHIPRIASIDPLSLQLQHFVNYIKGKKKPLTPISDGVEVVAVLSAIQESLQTGREVNMKEWLKHHA